VPCPGLKYENVIHRIVGQISNFQGDTDALGNDQEVTMSANAAMVVSSVGVCWRLDQQPSYVETSTVEISYKHHEARDSSCTAVTIQTAYPSH